MKTSGIGVALLALAATGAYGQTAANTAGEAALPAQARETPYAVVERGPHHRVWERTTCETGPDGRQVPQVHRYTELAAGLHYRGAQGEWAEANEEFKLLPGKAIARQGQHKATLNYNLNRAGAIELTTPDGVNLKSHVLCLSYLDASTGQSVLIAEVKDCEGRVSGNQVTYLDAFTDFRADVRYTYTKAGFEQDIILREQPPKPEEYGLNPETTRLQVLTEFVQAPQPAKRAGKLRDRKGVEMDDEELSFGETQLGRGKAFSLGREGQEIPVGKQWLKLEGRDFLLEEVSVADLEEELKVLPAVAESASAKPVAGSARHVVAHKRLLPEPKLARADKGEMKVAELATTRQGLVLDYVTLNTGQTNFTFKGDTTYYISGNLNLFGTNTFEGGAVIKYASNVMMALVQSWSAVKLNSQATAYRPVIFTAKDDNTVGESISGSTGNPSGYFANPALYFAGAGAQTLSYARFAYAKMAISAGGSTPTLSHVQFVNCEKGIVFSGSGAVVRNALFSNLKTNFWLQSMGPAIDVQNTTFSGSLYLMALNSSYSAPITLTNCILANVTNLYNVAPGSLFNGGWNGFYCSPTFGANTFTTTFNPFQTVGAGSCYLADGCAFRNVGTANINTTLLADLRKKTTYPPVVWSNMTVSANTTLVPQVQRDTDVPDLGYHYDPLDYCLSSVNMSGASLTLNNGVAVGFFGTNGLTLQTADSGFISQGAANKLNRLVRYHAVQETPMFWGPTNTSENFVAVGASGCSDFRCRFTEVSFLASSLPRRTLLDTRQCSYLPSFTLQDCFLRGINLEGINYTEEGDPGFNFYNNLFERSRLLFIDTGYYSVGVELRNNLFRGGVFSGGRYDYCISPWTIKDNLFDCDSLEYEHWDDGGLFDASNNGFQSSGDGPFGSDNKTGLTMNYVGGSATNWCGVLGNYYYPTNGVATGLTNLFNAGSRTAAEAGLYHHTVKVNNVKEGSETPATVDIGFHYVAANASGNPVDTDGDGLPDYFEDANGNGAYDSGSGESDWQTSFRGTTGVPGLKVYTPIRRTGE